MDENEEKPKKECIKIFDQPESRYSLNNSLKVWLAKNRNQIEIDRVEIVYRKK
jgi:hypothetical protein